MNNIVCPCCGESYYAENYSTRTAVYYPAIWKNGTNVNPDGNVTTTSCECINCHCRFSYQEQYGKVTNISIDEKPTTSVYTVSNQDIREAEIRRLESKIESLKEQLAEIKANPDWRQNVFI